MSTRCSISSLMMTTSTVPEAKGRPGAVYRRASHGDAAPPGTTERGARPVEADDS